MGRKQDRLFDESNIRKSCKRITITDDQRNAAIEWHNLLKNKKLTAEENNRDYFKDIVLKRLLGYDIYDYVPEKYDVDYFVEPKSSPKTLCFEIKGTSTPSLDSIDKSRPKEKETPIKQTWNYMGYLPSEYGICTNFNEFAILMSQERTYRKSHRFYFDSIINTENKVDDEKLKEFIGLFSKKGIFVDGILEILIDETTNIEEKFTEEFYKLYHETRLMLIKEFTKNKSDYESRKEAIYFAQIFLNRLIFIFFVEDHNFIPQKIFTTRLLHELKSPSIDESSHIVFDNIVDLFEKMNSGSKTLGINEFNGGLFAKKFPSDYSFLDIRSSNYFKDEFQNSKLKIKSAATDVLLASSSFSEQINPIIKNLLIIDSYDFTSDANVNILGHIFEQSISDLEALSEGEVSKRKKFGVFYTPDYITDYICRNTIIPYLSINNSSSVEQLVKEYENNLSELENKIKTLQILDPACGSGAFLVKTIDILLEIYEEIQKFTPASPVSQKGIDEFAVTSEINYFLENNIYGVDINEESVEITKLSLFLKLAGNDRKLSYLSNNIKVGNSVINDKNIDDNAFLWESGDGFPEILNSSKKNPGFDIIIGNPPYIRQESLSQFKEYFKNEYETFSSSADIYTYFIERSFKNLKPNGIFGIIVSSQFTKSSYGLNLRNFLSSKTIEKFIYFGDLPVFSDATTYPCIMIAKNISPDKDHMINYTKVNTLNFNSLSDYITNNSQLIDQSKLNKDEWRFISEKSHNIFTKIKSNSKDLISLEGVKLFRGILTGLNDAFIINNQTYKDIIKKNSNAKEIIKPFLRGDEIMRNEVDYQDKYIILTKKGIDIEKYPEVLKWLTQFKEKLETRGDQGDHWYELRSCTYYDEFEKPKILLRGLSLKGEFPFVEGPMYLIAPATVLSGGALHLSAVLQSKLIWFYIIHNCPLISGGFRRLYSYKIEKIPIHKSIDKYEKILSELSLKSKNLSKEYYENKKLFWNRIQSKFGPKKLTKKLESFLDLDFNSFKKELNKISKVKLTNPADEEIWEKYFNEKQELLLTINSNQKTLEDEIDAIVYEMYELTNEEIKIVETDVENNNS